MKKKFIKLIYRRGTSSTTLPRDGEIEYIVHNTDNLPKGSVDYSEPAESLDTLNVEFRLNAATLPGHNSSPASFPNYDITLPLSEKDVSPVAEWLDAEPRGSYGATSESFRKLLSEEIMTTMRLYFEAASDANLLTSPLLALAALRFPDGHHAAVSAPVMLIPTSSAPFARLNSWLTSDSSLSINISIINRPCALSLRIPPLKNLNIDDALSLDILLTRQATLYNPKGTAGRLRNFPAGGICHTDRESPLNETHCRGFDVEGYSPERIGAETVAFYEFFVAASIPVEALMDGTGTDFRPLPMPSGTISSLTASTPVLPDWSALLGIRGKSYSYNDRRLIPAPTISPSAPFPLFSSAQYSDVETRPIRQKAILYKKETETTGRRILIEGDSRYPDRIPANDRLFPRFIFYPDPDAMKIIVSDGTSDYILPLRSNPTLGGSFYFRGFDDSLPEKIPSGVNIADNPEKLWRDPESVYVSEKGSRRLFPARLRLRLGEDVTALSASTRAASGGQLGEFPLYCFVKSGIWLLRPVATGGYGVAQPISRDSATSPEGVVSTETGAAYIGTRGLTLLEGGSTKVVIPRYELPSHDIKGIRLEYDASVRKVICTLPGSSNSVVWLMAGDYIEKYQKGKDGKTWHEIRTLPITLSRPEVSKKFRNVEIICPNGCQAIGTRLEGSFDMRHWNVAAESPSSELRGVRCASYPFWRITARWEGHRLPQAIRITLQQ